MIGRDIAIPYLNYVGGEVAGRYMNQQLPFYGIHNLQVFDNSVVVGRLESTMSGNEALHHFNRKLCDTVESFFDILKGDDVWGGGAGYAYNSIIGLNHSVTFDMSNWDQKLGVYFVSAIIFKLE